MACSVLAFQSVTASARPAGGRANPARAKPAAIMDLIFMVTFLFSALSAEQTFRVGCCFDVGFGQRKVLPPKPALFSVEKKSFGRHALLAAQPRSPSLRLLSDSLAFFVW